MEAESATTMVAAALRHPWVRNAKASYDRFACGNRHLVLRVEQDDGAPGNGGVDAVGQWTDIFDAVYSMPAYGPDSTQNFVGAVNSHTGQAYSIDELSDMVECIVERLLELPHDRVLEIGCGTGVLLSKIAAHASRFVGTDPSVRALQHIREEILGVDPERVQAVELLAIPAHMIGSELRGGRFDLIVLNSVVQYFPSARYLHDVLDQAAGLLAPGGAIFVGDVRNLALHGPLHSSLLAGRTSGALPDVLPAQVLDHALHDTELVVDPQFFVALQHHIPGLESVRVSLKSTGFRNEFSLFRYDVVLGSGPAPVPRASIDWDGRSAEDTVRVGEHAAVRDIPNSRLCDVMVQWSSTVGVAPDVADGFDPVDLTRSVTARYGRMTEARWPRSMKANVFDVLPRDTVDAPVSDGGGELSALTNSPVAGTRPRLLARQLRTLLSEQLPAGELPTIILVRGQPFPDASELTEGLFRAVAPACCAVDGFGRSSAPSSV